MRLTSSSFRALGLTLSTFLLVGACDTLSEGTDAVGTGGALVTPPGSGGTETGTGSVNMMDIKLSPGGTGAGGTGQGLGGEGGDGVDTQVEAECARTDVSAVDTTVTLPADIIIVVDTSGSMAEETRFVQENLNQFSQQITDSGVDARVIVLAAPLSAFPDPYQIAFGICMVPPLGSGYCPEDTNLPNYVHLPITIGSVNALNLLTSSFDSWGPYLRPDSVKSILVVSDDDASPYPEIPYPNPYPYPYPVTPSWIADKFIADLEGLDPELFARWSLNAVYSFTKCGAAARVGEVYEELVTRTNGVAGDLCLQDFQPVFDKLAEQVVENAGSVIACEWELPSPVDGQTFSTALVEVTRTSTGGNEDKLTQVSSEEECKAGAWYFDDPTDPSRILACPEACEAMQNDAEGKINVVFGCEIVQGCSASGASTLVAVDPPLEGQAGAPSLGDAVGCDWPIPEADDGKTIDLQSVNLRYVTSAGFGVLLGQVEDVATCDSAALAWHYDDPLHPTRMMACPETCTALKQASVARVEALFGCQTKLADVVK